MTMTPGETLQAIKDAVAQHEAIGHVQWYVDELVIDCDAEEFWTVVRTALESGTAA